MMPDNEAPESVTRRGFLTKGVAAAAGLSGLAAALSPLKDINPRDVPTLEKFLQKHYKEMTPKELSAVLDRIRREVEDRYHVHAQVSAPPPMDGVQFVYALNISRCIGCRR